MREKLDLAMRRKSNFFIERGKNGELAKRRERVKKRREY